MAPLPPRFLLLSSLVSLWVLSSVLPVLMCSSLGFCPQWGFLLLLFFLHTLSLVISSAWWLHLSLQAGYSQITIFSPHLSWAPGPYTHLPCRWLHLGVSQHLTYSTCPDTTSTCPDLLSHKGPKPWSLLCLFIPNFYSVTTACGFCFGGCSRDHKPKAALKHWIVPWPSTPGNRILKCIALLKYFQFS